MLRVSGIGESSVAWNGSATRRRPITKPALQLVAKQGWAFQQHSLSPAEDQLTVETFRKGERGRRRSRRCTGRSRTCRGSTARPSTASRRSAPARRTRFGYLGTPGGGPPFRMIWTAAFTWASVRTPRRYDAESVGDDFLHGHRQERRRRAGQQGQQITREEALRLYTAENGWFFKEEDKLGSIEPASSAISPCLSDDYFDPRRVPDEAIRKLKSVLTVGRRPGRLQRHALDRHLDWSRKSPPER